MEPYDNSGIPFEPSDSQTQPVFSAPTGRKASPFADSPYVMQYIPEQAAQPNVQSPQQPGQNRHGSRTFVCLLLAALMVILGCGVTSIAVSRQWQQKMDAMADSLNNRIAALQEQLSERPSAGGQTPVSPEGGLTPSQVYDRNVQAVVAISNESTADINGEISSVATSGSGFLLTEDGYVVTNYHVVEDALHLTVITADGAQYTATVVGFDESNDIALLKIEAAGLPCVKLGSSDALTVGDQVVAIGNPLGEFTSTLTVGFVSGKDRLVNTDGIVINMLQTDAAINPGNSGGPLFNMQGEVIGITTAKFSGTTSSGASIEGLGFAIPIDDVAGMIDDLHQYGYITGAYLGVMVRSMDREVSQMYGLPMGAYVDSVNAGSCAETAGIRAKDIITNLGGYNIESLTDLTRALRKFKAGDTTSVEVWRAGRTEYLSITFDEKPHENTKMQLPEATREPDAESYGDAWWRDFLPPFFGNN